MGGKSLCTGERCRGFGQALSVGTRRKKAHTDTRGLSLDEYRKEIRGI
jgi:hypothetical protein